MAIINLVNPVQKLAYNTASATITFSTDATPAISTTVTGGANGTNFTVASQAGLVRGDFLSIETGGYGGTVPIVSILKTDPVASATIDAEYPALRNATTAAAAARMERFETRFHASKVTLTNLTNGDVHVWDRASNPLDNTAVKNGSVPITSNGICVRSSAIAIHPNLLLPSCNYTLRSDYDYYG